ncbi:hypothetical protein ETAA8_14800 [Anatilimnocola aggregata]|uniref:DUF1501 domain-containing protein n=1 Tax=Anatilimnocola aggregata TaxID=2528021 RepID=A0A517Y8D6_9BACT|nr:DUF1501 domain-containing protein [Anatilimnocola aggregata]QDU26402.1 hypothetical protein ETAA8_14800 [Anatilimnocola aggregata]
MLELFSSRRYRDCAGSNRRDFLKAGTLGLGTMGLGALSLPGLLQARAEAAASNRAVKDTSVVWLWLGGGATHVETFDPKMSAPEEYRSATGEVATNLTGVTIGGTLPKIASVADKMAFVRSFAHTNSGHAGGTHYVMTGYDNRKVDNGGVPDRPGYGSILSRVRGSNHPVTGMPAYVRMGQIRQGDGPAFLGPAYGPFDQEGQARKNMNLSVPEERMADRRNLLTTLDSANRKVSTSQDMAGKTKFEQQAFDLMFGAASQAFDISKESSKTREKYGSDLGKQMLTARRLCEAGCGFVTIAYGGWDMHGNIERSMKQRSPQLDQAVSAFVEDIYQRGLNEKILLVISGEFGRTPRINKNAGRDHWAPLSTLALAGGGLKMGQVVGESAPKVDVPGTAPIRPQDLMATIFHVLGIDPQVQFMNPAGRPVYMLDKGKPIAELV